MKTLTENEFIKNNKAETSIKIENKKKKIKKLSHSRRGLFDMIRPRSCLGRSWDKDK